MKLWVCAGCAVAYEAGIPRCPDCGATEHEEIDVPKTTKAGHSNAWEVPEENVQELVAEEPKDVPKAPERRSYRLPKARKEA